MNLTPAQAAAAEQERLDNEREELIYAVEGAFGREDYDEIRAALVEPLAAIRRHAAAAVLREQAIRLGNISAGYRRKADSASDISIALGFDAQAMQARADGRMLRAAADDVIAEGWEHQCAAETPATREDPAEGCETPVENEGDYCPRHEPADDYDPNEG